MRWGLSHPARGPAWRCSHGCFGWADLCPVSRAGWRPEASHDWFRGGLAHLILGTNCFEVRGFEASRARQSKMSLFLAAALGRTGLWVVRKVKFLRLTFPHPGTALVYLEKRARSDRWSGAGRAAVCAGGSSPQGSWKLLAVLRVCFREGDLFVGVFVGTCEEICGLCGAVCGIAKGALFINTGQMLLWFGGRSMPFLGRQDCRNDVGGGWC